MAARTSVKGPLAPELETFRRELTGYCYRMLGSSTEAEDAAQDTLIKAWRAHDGFQGRSSLRTWLYRIATNVCIDARRSSRQRVRPMDLGPASPHTSALPAARPDAEWLEPVADVRVLTTDQPAALAAERDSVRLAFVAALQPTPSTRSTSSNRSSCSATSTRSSATTSTT